VRHSRIHGDDEVQLVDQGRRVREIIQGRGEIEEVLMGPIPWLKRQEFALGGFAFLQANPSYSR
jgi:hypothetical protein